MRRQLLGASLISVAAVLCGCSGNQERSPGGDSIALGTVLPFTGRNATIGRNLEQALQLAVEDVNRAGGVDGHPLRLIVRDSNSGSERGLDALLELLYLDGVGYLIGPEETSLAAEIVPDVKALKVFNALPALTSPSVDRRAVNGAWLRLAPTPLALGCGLSELSLRAGDSKAVAITTRNDFNQSVVSEFSAEFFDEGGVVTTTVTVPTGQSSYAERAAFTYRADADRVLLVADPTSAATIVTEAAVARQEAGWLLGPSLQTPGFLVNTPPGSLEGAIGVSPTLSLKSECEKRVTGYEGPVDCVQANAAAFREHFAKRWDGDQPFPAAHFYYDAVLLIAMGLNYAAAKGDDSPSAAELHARILEMTNDAEARGRWNDLEASFEQLAQGTPLSFVGAAAEYEFDRYGAAEHLIFDAWSVSDQRYVEQGTFQTECTLESRWAGAVGRDDLDAASDNSQSAQGGQDGLGPSEAGAGGQFNDN